MGVLLPENMREKVIQEDPVDMEGMKEDQEGLLPLHLVGTITLLEEVVGFQKGGTGRHHLHIARCYQKTKNKKLLLTFFQIPVRQSWSQRVMHIIWLSIHFI